MALTKRYAYTLQNEISQGDITSTNGYVNIYLGRSTSNGAYLFDIDDAWLGKPDNDKVFLFRNANGYATWKSPDDVLKSLILNNSSSTSTKTGLTLLKETMCQSLKAGDGISISGTTSATISISRASLDPGDTYGTSTQSGQIKIELGSDSLYHIWIKWPRDNESTATNKNIFGKYIFIPNIGVLSKNIAMISQTYATSTDWIDTGIIISNSGSESITPTFSVIFIPDSPKYKNLYLNYSSGSIDGSEPAVAMVNGINYNVLSSTTNKLTLSNQTLLYDDNTSVPVTTNVINYSLADSVNLNITRTSLNELTLSLKSTTAASSSARGNEQTISFKSNTIDDVINKSTIENDTIQIFNNDNYFNSNQWFTVNRKWNTLRVVGTYTDSETNQDYTLNKSVSNVWTSNDGNYNYKHTLKIYNGDINSLEPINTGANSGNDNTDINNADTSGTVELAYQTNTSNNGNHLIEIPLGGDNPTNIEDIYVYISRIYDFNNSLISEQNQQIAHYTINNDIPEPEINYAWYAGQTDPSTMSSISPIVTSYENGGGWYDLGTTLPTSINQRITGGTSGRIWYVAVPVNSHLVPGSSSDPDTSVTTGSIKTFGTVDYQIYIYTGVTGTRYSFELNQ